VSILVAALSKAWVYSRSLAGFVGSNPSGVWISLLCVLCVVRERSVCQADYSFRGVIPCMMCLTFRNLASYMLGRPHRYPPNTTFYIFFQQLYILNFLNMLHTLRFFSSSKCN
jgi:hypothetical protein